jgi:hypothetical protein
MDKTQINYDDLEQPEMTDEQFNVFLEQLAKRIETSAKTIKDAAEIVRQAKAKI